MKNLKINKEVKELLIAVAGILLGFMPVWISYLIHVITN